MNLIKSLLDIHKNDPVYRCQLYLDKCCSHVDGYLCDYPNCEMNNKYIKKKMRTRIISAFPGTGKSFYYKNNKSTTLDSDSSEFSWIKDENGKNTKERNPEFPQNYIKHIKENIGKYKYIFVSSHKDVRDALVENCIFFYLVYPQINRKNEFLQRYIDRGSPEGFVSLISSKWNEWITECQNFDIGCQRVEMTMNGLSDELKLIEKSEITNLNEL